MSLQTHLSTLMSAATKLGKPNPDNVVEVAYSATDYWSTYIAPANGWFCAMARGGSPNTIEITAASASVFATNTSGGSVKDTIPVGKGMTVFWHSSGWDSGNDSGRFIYDIGATN